jgi:hypothetical protein
MPDRTSIIAVSRSSVYETAADAVARASAADAATDATIGE